MLNIKLIIGAISLILLIIILELIRRKKLKERYSLLWIVTCFGIFLFSFMPKLFAYLSDITGMYYLSIISTIAFLFVLIMLLHFSVVISKLHERSRILTQKQALLEEKIKELENNAGK